MGTHTFSLVMSVIASCHVNSGVELKENMRGVRPEDQTKYVTAANQGSFHCDGGPVPFSAVNDDFCDCTDGSDEPSTDACAGQSQTHFYCPNVQSIPAYIYSSRVNDGVCDCCDGSDERDIICQNTCDKEGVDFRKDLERRRTAWKSGAAKRDELIRNAKKERENNVRVLSELKERLPLLEAAEKSAYTHAGKESDSQPEKHQQKREDSHKIPDNTSTSTNEGNAEPTLESFEASSGASVSANGASVSEYAKWMEGAEEAHKLAEQNDKIPEVTPDFTIIKTFEGPLGIVCDSDTGEILELKEGRQGEQSGLRIGWYLKEVNGKSFTNALLHDAIASGAKYDVTFHRISMPSETLRHHSSTTAEVQTESVRSDEKGEEDEDEFAEEDDGSLIGAILQWASGAWEAIIGKMGTPLERASSELTDARNKIQKLEKKLTSELDELRVAYATLESNCLSNKLKQYKYEICFFERAKQDSTSLGKWQSWESAHVGVFSNGQYCPGGPSRSLRVHFECGPDNEILEITEPSRCTYEARVVHPGACVGIIPEELSSGKVRMPTDEL